MCSVSVIRVMSNHLDDEGCHLHDERSLPGISRWKDYIDIVHNEEHAKMWF